MFLASNYLFKVNKKDIRPRFKICSNLTTKTTQNDVYDCCLIAIWKSRHRHLSIGICTDTVKILTLSYAFIIFFFVKIEHYVQHASIFFLVLGYHNISARFKFRAQLSPAAEICILKKGLTMCERRVKMIC